MKIVFAGGGTGGHLYPAIAMAKELIRRHEASEVLFVGTSEGLEARILPEEGFDLKTIRMMGVKGKKTMEQLRALISFPVALAQSLRILRTFRPDAVIGVGGYASGPVVMAAWLLRMHTMLQEQNSVPGATNRMLARFAERIYTAYEAAEPFFPRHKVLITGNPLRSDLLQGERREGMKVFGLQEGRKTVLIFGGSLGAHAINELVSAMVSEETIRQMPVQFVHQTGADDCDSVRAAYEAAGLAAEVRPYFQEMGLAYSVADMAISRAGAVALSELQAAALPAILIPFPFAADDHQMKNARALEATGAAVVFDQNDLTPARLAAVVGELLGDEARLAGMQAAARREARPDAAGRIVDDVERIVRRAA